jgi:hypothetical protein
VLHASHQSKTLGVKTATIIAAWLSCCDESDSAAGIGSQQHGGAFGVGSGLLGAGVYFSPQQQHVGFSSSSAALTLGSRQHHPNGNAINTLHR